MKNIGEKIYVSGNLKAETKGSRRKIIMKLHEDKYILGYEVFEYMLGFKDLRLNLLTLKAPFMILSRTCPKKNGSGLRWTPRWLKIIDL